jgi:hypothetical protein
MQFDGIDLLVSLRRKPVANSELVSSAFWYISERAFVMLLLAP